MPGEYFLLKDKPLPMAVCPKCGALFEPFLRGLVQRKKCFLGLFKKRNYCAVICYACKGIVGWESPPSLVNNNVATPHKVDDVV